MLDAREAAVSHFLFRLSIHIADARPRVGGAHEPLGMIVVHGEVERQFLDVLRVETSGAVRRQIDLPTVRPGFTQHRRVQRRDDELAEHVHVRRTVLGKRVNLQARRVQRRETSERWFGHVTFVRHDAIRKDGVSSAGGSRDGGIENQWAGVEKVRGEQIDGVERR